jgi:2-oxo-4-hydroxy-4-carboxy-5-ureidoimidazoline decarboxylase
LASLIKGLDLVNCCDLACGRETLGLMTAAALPPDRGDGLAEFNALPAAAAREALLACCSSPRWAVALTAGRPYLSVAMLLRCSDDAAAGLAPADLRDALAGHPRLGERPGGDSGGGAGSGPGGSWPGQEQAGLAAADQAAWHALAAGNQAYERRFGHIYLARATGRTAAELLALLNTRLANEPAAEWGVVRSELQKINHIRLGKLLAGLVTGPPGGSG